MIGERNLPFYIDKSLKEILDINKNRFDIIVRYLFISSNNSELYLKMQKRRLPNDNINWLKSFNTLIRSIKKTGFNRNSPIIVNNNYKLIDGSHRLACALYFEIENITLKMLDTDSFPIYDFNWFKCNNFNQKELKLIKNKHRELLN